MQESFYESGNCVQIICAIQGVHPKQFESNFGPKLGFYRPFFGDSVNKANRIIRTFGRGGGDTEPSSSSAICQGSWTAPRRSDHAVKQS